MKSHKKVIWIINQYAGSPIHGMTFRTYYLAKHFLHNYEVNIFSASYTHVMSNPPKVFKSTKEVIDGVNYYWIKVFKYAKSNSISRVLSMFLFMFKLFFFSTKNINKPSVIIVSSISPLPIFKAYLWAKKYNSKLIFEVRDIWPLSLIELGGFKTYNPFVLILQLTENFAYKVSDYVVSLLPDAFKHMKKHGLSSDRFKHIPNGIDLKMEQLEVCDEIASAIPKNKFVVAYTGAVGIANSLMTLVKAANLMKKNKDIVFIIVGDGSEKKNILEQKDKLGLDNLLLLDPIPKSSVIPFLKKYVDVCYIGLQRQPLFRFGVSPNKMFDYLFSKTPIIQSIDSSNDIVQLSGSGISVEADNPSKIAEAVNTLYNMSKSERDLLGEKGLEYVIENHSYQKLAQHYESLFD